MYLDDIFIYTDDDGDGHIAAVRWVLGQLRKYSLYANLKKCRFHQEEVWFLGYVVFSKGIHIEDKRSRQSSSGLSPSQYEKSKFSSDLPTFIGDSSRDSVG